MQIATKNKRKVLIDALLNLVPDAIIALIAAVLANNLITFFAVIFGLQIIYFLIWVKNSIWLWIKYYYLGGKKELLENMLKVLRTNNYPEPDELEVSVQDYFLKIANNEKLPTDVRIKAGAEYGTFHSPIFSGNMQNTLRLNMAYETALEMYKKQFADKNQDLEKQKA